MTTRCLRCGIGYMTREIGEVCGDRSRSYKHAAKHGHDIVISCPGRLVRPEDYRRAPVARTNNPTAT